MQLSIVNVHAKGILDGIKVCSVSVCSDLHAALDATGGVLHEIPCPVSPTPTDKIADNEFCISVNSNPCPNITPPNLLFRGCHVLGFCADICPYFVTLKTAYANIAHMLVVVLHTRLTKINEQLCYCVSRRSGHARGRTNAVSFNQ